jgi:hypothetical protein
MVAAGGGGGSSDIVGGGITGVDGINSDTGTKATGATQTNRGTGFIDGGSL